MNAKTRSIGTALCAGAFTVALACAGLSAGNTQPAVADAQGGEPSYSELVEMYPQQYDSAMTHKTDEEGEDNSHAGFQDLMETPAIRDVSGAIVEVVEADSPLKTDVAIKCVACKSSQFVPMFEANGVDAFTTMILDDENMAFLDGQYWDCYSCHTWEDGELGVEARAAYADASVFPLVAAAFDTLNEDEVICGQCHNTVSSRGWVKVLEDTQTYDPYRYGFDLDARYQAMVEDGMYSVDAATGMLLVSMNHPQIELYQGSIHQAMGLSCVSCHMPQTAGEDGVAYTSHNASGSVAQNDVAMEACLTCHANQSDVETVEDMRAFLADAQAAQAARQLEVQAGLDELYALILAAVENGGVDEDALQQAKDAYSMAFWLISQQQQNLCDPADGAQIAHDPVEMRTMLERANALVEDAKALFA